jgi:Ca2+-binding RTX toxin-like protein
VTVDGGAGTDTLNIKAGNSSVVFTNFEVIQMTDGANAVNVSQFSGKTMAVKGFDGGDDTLDFTTASKSIDSATIDLSKLLFDTNVIGITITGSAVASSIALGTPLTITGSSIADTVDLTTQAGANTISTGAGADVITGGTVVDTILPGEGADTLISGTGLDIINLTETTSAADVLKYAVAATTDIDTVTGFKSGTDIISITAGNIAGAGTYTLANTAGADLSTTAAGGLTPISVAKDATAVTSNTTDGIIFFSNTSATSFATAIGTTTISTDDADAGGVNSELAATEGVIATWYDATNSQAVFGFLLNSSTATADVLNSVDTFVEIARVGMVSTDYTLANIDASLAVY